MVKKISLILISVAIVATGYIAFGRLNYWERSVRIFKLSDPARNFEGRGGRVPGSYERGAMPGTGERSVGRDGFREGYGRPERNPVRDSLMRRFGSEMGRPQFRDRNFPDSLKRQFRQHDADRPERITFEGIGNRGSHGRSEFPGGKKISLRNVLWFLAVFASFTVAAIYLDKVFCLFRKKESSRTVQRKTSS